jgi:hypothetical protein
MRELVRTALLSLGLGTIVLLGGAGAADAHPRRGADVNVLDGSAQIQAGACGNAVGVLGDARANCEGSQDARGRRADDTDGGGIDADVGGPTSAQANACGNAVGVLGDVEADCGGSQRADATTRDDTDGGGIDADVSGPTSAQANACGNAVGVAGDVRASCQGSQDADADTGDDGTAGRNEIDVLRWGQAVQAGACGNAVGALGDAQASCQGSQDADAVAGDDAGGGGTDADVGGPTQAQANVCGNSVGVLGDARASCRGPQSSPGGEPGVETPPAGAEGEIPSGVPPPGVLGAGGGPAVLGRLAVTGASFDRLAIAMLFLVGFASIWATGRGEEDRQQR